VALARTIFRDFKKLYTFQAAAEKSARHVTAADLSFIESGALVAEKGNVLWTGPSENIPSEYKKNAKVHKMKGLIGYPAFVECHTHAIFAGARAEEFEFRLQGASYQEIAGRGGGIASTVKAVRAADDKTLLRLAQERVDAFARQGVTTLEIKSGYGLDFENESRILKIAQKLKGPAIVPTYLGPHSLAPGFSSCQAYLEECIHDLEKIKKQNLSRRADIFIEKNFFELPWAEQYLKRASELGFDLVVHGEQLTRGGSAPLAIAYGAKSLDHGVHVSKDDVSRLANSEVTAVLLPAADFYMKLPYPPARALIDRGARVALATDFNPGTSPTQDLAFVGLLARLEMGMTLAEVFCAYTLGAAYALGLEASLGSLTPGKRADFLTSESEPEDFFYSIGESPVHGVFRGGREMTV
jgi:imidazolonepropionase